MARSLWRQRIVGALGVAVCIFANGSSVASDCSQIRDPELKLACTLQGLRVQPPGLPREAVIAEARREDEFYRKELHEYVFRPCALRDAARVKGAKGLDYAVDTVIAAFHVDTINRYLATVRVQPWPKRVLSYYSLLHLCLMTERKKQ